MRAGTLTRATCVVAQASLLAARSPQPRCKLYAALVAVFACESPRAAPPRPAPPSSAAPTFSPPQFCATLISVFGFNGYEAPHSHVSDCQVRLVVQLCWCWRQLCVEQTAA